jgi:hypothetical protein
MVPRLVADRWDPAGQVGVGMIKIRWNALRI